MSTLKSHLLLVSTLVVSIFLNSSFGQNRYVPDQYLTIQAAVTASVNGDVVVIRDGIYTGTGNRDITFGGRLITVKSENGPDNCIIDCQATSQSYHRGFRLEQTESGIVIEGLTIKNGCYDIGGAIYCMRSNNLLVKNCVIYDCKSIGDGGGIYVFGYASSYISARIQKCKMYDNNATSDSGGGYGGSVHGNYANLTISDCEITNNQAFCGGGVSCYGTVTVSNTVFCANLARGSGQGGGLHGFNVTVNNSCFYRNQGVEGSAIYGGISVINNCTILENRSVKNESKGAICSSFSSSSITISNSLIWGNESFGHYQIWHGSSGNVVVTYSDVQYGRAGLCATQGNITWTNNISEDPLFQNENDYHLSSYSPCVDSGDPSYTPIANETDIDGLDRICSNRVDIGADETVARWYVDINAQGTGTGKSWENAFVSIQAAINAADTTNGDVITVAPGVYFENINLNGKAITLCGTSPKDWAVVASTVIDGGEQDNVVECINGENEKTVIEGLTIRNSGTVYGYRTGVYCLESSPVIRNCILDDNWCGIWCNYSHPTLYNNIIKNSADTGIMVSDDSPYIFNNLIYGSGFEGITIVYEDNGKAIVENNTIVNNENYGIMCLVSDPIINNCILWNNGEALYGGSPVYSCVQGGNPGVGNISDNPSFIDPNNYNFNLSGNSPCIDVGGSSYCSDSEFDINNQKRINGNSVDIGADESDPHIIVTPQAINYTMYEGEIADCNMIIANVDNPALNYSISTRITDEIENATVELQSQAQMLSAAAAPDSNVRLTTNSSNSISVEYNFSQPEFQKEDQYDIVQMAGLSLDENSGEPALPVRTVRILIPNGKDITGIRVVPASPKTMAGQYNIRPGKEPIPVDDRDVTLEKLYKPNKSVYSQKTEFPSEVFKKVGVYSLRGYRYLMLNIYPVRYVPSLGKIDYVSKIKITVDFKEGAKQKKPHLMSGVDKRMLSVDNQETLVTYSETSQASTANLYASQTSESTPIDSLSEGPYQYVVITSEELKNSPAPWNFQALCNSKNERGITAGIITTEWIYTNYAGTRPAGGQDNPTKLRAFLIDAYNKWGTEYALLGGNSTIIPVRYLRGLSTDIPADLYYGCVDPAETFDWNADGIYGTATDGSNGGDVDRAADIYIGRAAVENMVEVGNFVRKTLTYSSGSLSQESLSNITMLGEYLNPDYAKKYLETIRLGCTSSLGAENPNGTIGFENHTYSEYYKYDISNNLYDFDLYPNQWTPQNFADLANSGIHIFHHLAHSNAQSMGRTRVLDLPLFLNEKPFFIYSEGCNPGCIDYIADGGCFAEAITTMKYGAFAAIMNSREGWFGYGTDMSRQFYDAILSEQIYSIGKALQDSKNDMLWGTGTYRWEIYQINLFGDPELELKMSDKCFWLAMSKDQGTLNRAEIDTIPLELSAGHLLPGQYESNIKIKSNDVNNSLIEIPVNLNVLAESPEVTPEEGVVFNLNEGQRQFGSNVVGYTLKNTRLTQIAWQVSGDVGWVTIAPSSGVLQPNGTVEVSVSLNDDVCELPIGSYSGNIVFQNTTYNKSRTRGISLNVVKDYCTEEFSNETVDLQNRTLYFSPYNNGESYAVTSVPATAFPTDPTGGTVIEYASYLYYTFAEIDLSNNKSIPFYGQAYNTVYVSGNGLITFESSATLQNPLIYDITRQNHFQSPSISALYSYLAPWDGGEISYKQLDDRIVFTFLNVPEDGYSTNLNSFQTEIYFNGTIRITYLGVSLSLQEEGCCYYVGISQGSGVPENYLESDMSAYTTGKVYSNNLLTWYNNIQAAINNAQESDEIVVFPGIYTGTGNRDIDPNGKALTIRSVDPSSKQIVEATVIDCQSSSTDRHRGFVCVNGEESSTILSGLTIQHGRTLPVTFEWGGEPFTCSLGSAIFCDGSSPTITNCIFKDNVDEDEISDGTIACINNSDPYIENCTISNNSCEWAGGITCWIDSSPEIVNCQIKNNTASIGGVSCFTNCSPIIRGCDISDNTMFLSGYHNYSGTGGVYCYDTCSPVIENCTINNNYADYGGALYFEGESSNPVMRNCVIAGNHATQCGGAVCGYYGNAQIINCTIINNSAGTCWGGGLAFGLGGSPVIKNCIIYGNTAPTGPQVYHVAMYATYSYCDIQGSGGSGNWNVPGGIDGGGNIDTSPLFISSTNFHLSSLSPCIDTGTVANYGTTDIDGDNRVIDISGKGDGVNDVDMGADEYQP